MTYSAKVDNEPVLLVMFSKAEVPLNDALVAEMLVLVPTANIGLVNAS